jgi:adenylylsulfate kinase-like enzyme
MANKLKAPVLTGKEIAKIGAEGGSDGDPLRRSLSRAFCFSSVDRVTAEARGGNFERSCRKVGQEKSKIDGQ